MKKVTYIIILLLPLSLFSKEDEILTKIEEFISNENKIKLNNYKLFNQPDYQEDIIINVSNLKNIDKSRYFLDFLKQAIYDDITEQISSKDLELLHNIISTLTYNKKGYILTNSIADIQKKIIDIFKSEYVLKKSTKWLIAIVKYNESSKSFKNKDEIHTKLFVNTDEIHNIFEFSIDNIKKLKTDLYFLNEKTTSYDITYCWIYQNI